MTSIENERIQKSKKKAREYIEKEQLVSFMNNTKWEEFSVDKGILLWKNT